jgi:hypothetical protein
LEETLNRELRPFTKISDGYEKILIANTNQFTYHIDGIKIIDLAFWLMEFD